VGATIRRAGPQDAEQLASLNRVVQDLHRQRRPDYFRSTPAGEAAAWYRALFQRPTAGAWLAELEGRAVGYLLTEIHHRPQSPFTFDHRWLELDQLAVETPFRRQGIARALITAAISDAREHGIRSVEATSWVFNEATHAVLRELGFSSKTVRFEIQHTPHTRSGRRVT